MNRPGKEQRHLPALIKVREGFKDFLKLEQPAAEPDPAGEPPRASRASSGELHTGLTPAALRPLGSASLFTDSRSDDLPLARLSREWQDVALYKAS